MASALTTEGATLTDGPEQEGVSQLDRIEAMLVWLCEAMEGEQDGEDGPVVMTLDGQRRIPKASHGGTL